MTSHKRRIAIIPRSVCQCSDVCGQIVCVNVWSDGSESPCSDFSAIIDSNLNVKVYTTDSFQNKFERFNDYCRFIDFFKLQCEDLIF